MQTLTTDDGVKLAFRCHGPADAPALVLSHALGANHRMWDDQLDALAGSFRVVLYDSRGQGASEAPEGDYSIERLGRDVLCLLDYLNLDRASFCGLSLGGMVGQWLGSAAGSRIERLVLANTSPFANPAIWRARVELARGEGMAALIEPTLERWFTAGFRERAPRTVDRIRGQLRSTLARGYAACAAAIRDMDQREAVRCTLVPTLVIAGAHDQATPPDKTRDLHDAIAGSVFLELDAAHLSNVERPAEFNDALLAFLAH